MNLFRSLLSWLVLALLGSLALTACSGPTEESAAQRLVGRPRITDDEAKRLTGAGSVRQIAPGQPVIQNYSNTRLTVETDPATGRITAASCG